MKTQTIEIQTGSLGLKKKISAVQNDSDRQLKCILADFAIPEGAAVRIYAVKPSGAKIYNDGTIEGSNAILIDLTTQCLAEVGEVACQVEITESNGKILTSFEFGIDVKKQLKDSAAVESSNQYSALENALIKTQGLDNRISNNEKDIVDINTRITQCVASENALSTRMDSFTSLTEGSTTGDAELVDARVGYNGAQFSNLGDSLRTQLELHDLAIGYVKGDDITNTLVNKKRYRVINGILDLEENNARYSRYWSAEMDCEPHKRYIYEGVLYNYANQYSVIILDSDRNVLQYFLQGDTQTKTPVDSFGFITPTNAATIVIQTYDSNGYLYEAITNIEENANEISAISEIVENSRVPSYYNDYMAAKKKEIKQVMLDSSGLSDSFVFATDIHFPRNNNMSGRLIKSIKDSLGIKKVFMGGDICPAYITEYPEATTAKDALNCSISDYMDKIINPINSGLFQMKGNHDFTIKTSSDPLDTSGYTYPSAAVKNVYMQSNDSSIVTNNADENACYYYYDDEKSRIRYIVIDACDKSTPGNLGFKVDYSISEEQTEWIIEQAILTAPSNYKYVFFSHVSIVDVCSTGNDYRRDTYKDFKKIIDDIQNKEVTSEYDFSNCGDILAFITGHEHQDIATFDNDILHYTVLCDANYSISNRCPVANHFDVNTPAKTPGTVYEQTFDIINIDAESKVINAIRFGSGGNKIFNLTPITVAVNDTTQLTTRLTGDSISWWAYDSTGRDIGANYVVTLHETVASVSNGLVTGLIAGGSVVVACNGTDFEYFNVIVNSSGEETIDKAIMCFIDDDAQTGSNDLYAILEELDVPYGISVPVATIGSSGHLSIADLTEREIHGADILLHGAGGSEDYKTMSLDDIKTSIDTALTFADTNGFNKEILVYPSGLQPNTNVADITEVFDYMLENGINYGMNVNTAVESSSKTGYEDWCTYSNGQDCAGVWNKIPFVNMPNNYSKALLLNRQQYSSNFFYKRKSYWFNNIQALIDSKGIMIVFTHGYNMSGDVTTYDGETTTLLNSYRDFINYIKTNCADTIEILSPTEALDKISRAE